MSFDHNDLGYMMIYQFSLQIDMLESKFILLVKCVIKLNLYLLGYDVYMS